MRLIAVIVFGLVACQQTAVAEKYIPIAAGQPSPVDGIVMTEEEAGQVAAGKIELKEVTGLYEVDKKLWIYKEQEYVQLIARQNEELGSWWNRNKFEAGIVIGTVLWIAVSAVSIKAFQIMVKQ